MFFLHEGRMVLTCNCARKLKCVHATVLGNLSVLETGSNCQYIQSIECVLD